MPEIEQGGKTSEPQWVSEDAPEHPLTALLGKVEHGSARFGDGVAIGRENGALVVADVDGRRTILCPELELQAVRLSPDGRRALIEGRKNYAQLAYEVDFASGDKRLVYPPGARRQLEGIDYSGPDHLVALGHGQPAQVLLLRPLDDGTLGIVDSADAKGGPIGIHTAGDLIMTAGEKSGGLLRRVGDRLLAAKKLVKLPKAYAGVFGRGDTFGARIGEDVHRLENAEVPGNPKPDPKGTTRLHGQLESPTQRHDLQSRLDVSLVPNPKDAALVDIASDGTAVFSIVRTNHYACLLPDGRTVVHELTDSRVFGGCHPTEPRAAILVGSYGEPRRGMELDLQTGALEEKLSARPLESFCYAWTGSAPVRFATIDADAYRVHDGDEVVFEAKRPAGSCYGAGSRGFVTMPPKSGATLTFHRLVEEGGRLAVDPIPLVLPTMFLTGDLLGAGFRDAPYLRTLTTDEWLPLPR